MPLPDVKLDDRQFQDLVDEAKSRITRYCPEWTDHNVSDPGVTLIELFAWMMDVLLYRVNRVPEKNYIRFLDMLGIRLLGATPARTGVTFWFSAAQETKVTIKRGTEVSTLRSERDQSIVFTTDEDLEVPTAGLKALLTTPDGKDGSFTDHTSKLALANEYCPVFATKPKVGNMLYIRFANNLDRCILRLEIGCRLVGVGVTPESPPLIWEAWCGANDDWLTADVETDDTGGLNKSGAVVLQMPRGIQEQDIEGQKGFWLRLRLIEHDESRGQRPYSASPEISTMTASTVGGTAMATHARVVAREILGRVSRAGQTLQLANVPVLARHEDEVLEVENEDGSGFEPWTEVTSFAASGPDDPHYTLDSGSGEIEFGPRIRQQDGHESAYGRAPGRNKLIAFRQYRYGGGVVGNVGANALTILKSSIPYVARVQNRRPATGGQDPEALENAKLRAPQGLRARNRAVTAEDFEYLAREASQSVARARCLPSAAPGGVDVLIVPAVAVPPGQLTLDVLQPRPELRLEVERYLDERRLITTRLNVDGPAYVGVKVVARVVINERADTERVQREIVERLARHVDPLAGGPDGTGWPFGRSLFASELLAVIQGVAGVEFVPELTLSEVDPRTGEDRPRDGADGRNDRIDVPADALLLPHRLDIQLQPRTS